MRIPAEDAVQKQLTAYNALDVESFVSFYAEDAVIFKNGAELMAGKEALRERYGKLFTANPDLRCVVVRRVTEDGTVTDDEIVTGTTIGELRARVRYEVKDGLIRRVDISSGHGSED